MPSTTNFNWTTPADTDLVKDGAAAIRTLGNNIDASLVDLKGGTTGQVLAKASNTDLDFTWSSVDPLTILDAKGDLITATAADTPARLAVGANNTVLTADSTTSTGLKWAAVEGGGYTELATGSLSGSAVNLTSIAGTYRDLVWVLNDIQVTAACDLLFRVNNNSGSNYRGVSIRNISGVPNLENNGVNTSVPVSAGSSYGTGDNNNAVIIRLYDYANTTNFKLMTHIESYQNNTGQRWEVDYRGSWNQTTAIDQVNIIPSGTTFAGGTYKLYGVK